MTHYLRVAGLLSLVGILAGCAGTGGAGNMHREALAEAVKPSLVRVEYTLQFDNGEAPRAGGWSQRCPNCGQYHSNNLDQLINDERPLEVGGFLLSPTRVLSADIQAQSRFVKKITVRFGDQVVDATIGAWLKNQNGVILELSKPLTGASPLQFDAERKAPYYAVTYTRDNTEWVIHTQGMSTVANLTSTGRRFVPATSYCVITDRNGAAVGASLNDELPMDGSWKGSPLDWQAYSAREMAELLAAAEKRQSQALLTVVLNFRSPKATRGRESFRSSRDSGDENATVQNAIGVLVSEKTAMVLLEMKPNLTARLEKIRVQNPQGEAVGGKFVCTLADYGCFLIELEKPLPGAVKLAEGDIRGWRTALLPAVEVKLQGEKRVNHVFHQRIASFDVGWHQHIYPQLSGGAQHTFLFDASGTLVAFPVGRREKVSAEERWRNNRDEVLTAGGDLAAAVANPAKYADAANVPLSDGQESRLAWLGVELQALNQELARVNNVAALTNDGQTGAIITYVYPDSPAAKAGLQTGWILLRLNVADEPKPLDVKIQGYSFSDQPFPWERLGDCPEQYFDQIPCPWPSAENELTRALTDLGFGRKFQAEFFHDGQITRSDFAVIQSPPHYDSAARFKNEPLGVTVRAITYEVRRYFQRQPDEPGVIISKIEAGSKASVSGLKPFEIITHVNDAPVGNVTDFEKLTAGKTDLRLTVKRMTRGRIVKIDLSAAPANAK